MGRPRKDKRIKIENLYVSKEGRCRYRRPDNGEYISLGTIGKDITLDDALNAASQANNQLWAPANLLDRILTDAKKSKPKLVADHIDYMLTYWEQRVSENDMSKVTFDTYRRQVNHFKKAFADRYFNTLTKLDLSGFLEKFNPTLKMRYRAVLSVVWKHAISRGLTDTDVNIIDTILKEKIKVKQKRLTREAYKIIWSKTEPCFQNAFDLALQTLQRREDISEMLKQHIVTIDGIRYLRVKQIKTGALVQMKILPKLDEILKRCNDNVVSPFILHYPYATGSKRKHIGKKITKDVLSRAFKKARDKAMQEDGLFKEMTALELPSFRQLRSLGAKIMEEEGRNPQLLLGHTDEKMTKVYLDRYEEKWVISEAGIEI